MVIIKIVYLLFLRLAIINNPYKFSSFLRVTEFFYLLKEREFLRYRANPSSIPPFIKGGWDGCLMRRYWYGIPLDKEGQGDLLLIIRGILIYLGIYYTSYIYMNENFNPQKFINYNRGRTVFARKLRKNQTQAEKLLWERLRKDKLGVRFLRQKPLGPYIADFYCASVKLCIELDWSSHDAKEEYDIDRTAYLNDNHVRVIRCTNDEVEYTIDTVIQRIQDIIDQIWK